MGTTFLVDWKPTGYEQDMIDYLTSQGYTVGKYNPRYFKNEQISFTFFGEEKIHIIIFDEVGTAVYEFKIPKDLNTLKMVNENFRVI